jgi:hypothetical protein
METIKCYINTKQIRTHITKKTCLVFDVFCQNKKMEVRCTNLFIIFCILQVTLWTFLYWDVFGVILIDISCSSFLENPPLNQWNPHVGPTNSMVNLHISCTEMDKRCAGKWNQPFLFLYYMQFIANRRNHMYWFCIFSYEVICLVKL